MILDSNNNNNKYRFYRLSPRQWYSCSQLLPPFANFAMNWLTISSAHLIRDLMSLPAGHRRLQFQRFARFSAALDHSVANGVSGNENNNQCDNHRWYIDMYRWFEWRKNDRFRNYRSAVRAASPRIYFELYGSVLWRSMTIIINIAYISSN